MKNLTKGIKTLLKVVLVLLMSMSVTGYNFKVYAQDSGSIVFEGLEDQTIKSGDPIELVEGVIASYNDEQLSVDIVNVTASNDDNYVFTYGDTVISSPTDGATYEVEYSASYNDISATAKKLFIVMFEEEVTDESDYFDNNQSQSEPLLLENTDSASESIPSNMILSSPPLRSGLNKRSICLVTDGVAENIIGDQNSNIYFGNYLQSDDGSGWYNYEPIKWRVLDPNNNKMFLVSDMVLDSQYYDKTYTSGIWEASTMRAWLNGLDEYNADNFKDTAFTNIEQKIILDTNVVNKDNTNVDPPTPGGNNTVDKVFLLSVEEALSYGFSPVTEPYGAANRIAYPTAYAVNRGVYKHYHYSLPPEEIGMSNWFLRSPGGDDKSAAYVDLGGMVSTRGRQQVNTKSMGTRPALNINSKSIVLTSSVEYKTGKGSGTVGELSFIGINPTNNWKLTLLDDGSENAVGNNHSGFEIDSTNIVYSNDGNTITVPYSGAKTGDNEYISAIITDSNKNVKYYGRIISVSQSRGDVTFDITNLTGNDRLYIINEQYNGIINTDYSSSLKEVSYPVTVITDGNGTASANPESGTTDTAVNITAEPNTGYRFLKWEVLSGGVYVENLRSESTSFAIKNRPVKLKAIFESEDAKYGALSITKKVVADDINTNEYFSFEIYFHDQQDNPLVEEVFYNQSNNEEIRTDEDGVIRFSLKHNETLTISKIPEDTGFIFEECTYSDEYKKPVYSYENGGKANETDDYVVGQITGDSTIGYVVTNIKKNYVATHNLTIRKEANAQGEFNFEIISDNKLDSDRLSPINYQELFDSTSIPNGGSSSIDYIGYEYNQEYLTLIYENSSWKLLHKQFDSFLPKETNILTQEPTITRDDENKIVDASFEYNGYRFHFSHDGGGDYALTIVPVKFIYRAKISSGDSITIENIPYGTEYEIYETDSQYNRVQVGGNIGSTGWILKSITGSSTGTLTQDTEVTFTNEKSALTVTVSDDGNGTGSASPASGKKGTEVTITATPNEGYEFAGWELISGDVVLADVTSETTTFTLNNEDVEVMALFKRLPKTDTITVTKKWVNDTEKLRPDIKIHIKSKSAYLIDGLSLNSKMRSLAGDNTDWSIICSNVKTIKWATEDEYNNVKANLTSENEVQEKGEKVFMWFDDGNGTIYFYSTVSNIFMNANSEKICAKFVSLTDISAFSHFDASYVTDLNRIFINCGLLKDFSPISKWDTHYVTDLTFAFGYSVSNADAQWNMAADSLEALRNWDVSNVLSFNQTFKGWNNLTSLEPISNWNVSKAQNMSLMFRLTMSLEDEGRDYIKDWNVRRVTNFDQVFLYNPIDPDVDMYKPIFTKRPGEWITNSRGRKGIYSPFDNALPALEPDAPLALPKVELEYTSDDKNCTITKDGDTWTYTFEVPAGYIWSCWEETKDGKLDDAKGLENAYTESSNGVDGLGSSEEKAINNVTEKAEITNTRTYSIITYHLNGGSYAGSKEDIVEEYKNGTEITIHDAPARPGYTFLYWEGSKYYPGDKFQVKENHTFKAQWQKKVSPVTPKYNVPKTGVE